MPIIKKIPSKKDLRKDLNREVEAFLAKGESVTEVPRGVSSRDSALAPLKPETWQMDKSKGEWTYLPEVVDTLEQRRAEKSRKPTPVVKSKRPKKKMIYDDFGEPLRWIWVDE